MKTRAIKFFSNKTDILPADCYPFFKGDTSMVFAIHNWLEMYPNGKVEIEEITLPR